MGQFKLRHALQGLLYLNIDLCYVRATKFLFFERHSVMKLTFFAAAMAIAEMMMGMGRASASTTTYTYDAVFSRGPLASITGTVTIDYLPASSVVTNFTSSVPSSYDPFTYYSFAPFIDSICDNTTPGSECEVDAGQNKLTFTLIAPKGILPDSPDFFYSGTGQPGVYDADKVTFAPSTVPLPSSAPMFGAALAALGLIGCAVRRGRRSASA